MKYLIPSVTRWLNRCLAPYTLMQSYLISALLLLCIVVIWYTALYKPVYAKIAFYKNEISLKDQTLKNGLDEVMACSRVHHAIQALTHDLESFKNKYIDGNTVLVAIMHEANSHGLDSGSCMSSETIDHDWYTITPFTSTVKGSLQSIGLWLKAVTQALTVCTIQQLRLTFEQAGLFRSSCIFHVTQVKKSPSTLGS